MTSRTDVGMFSQQFVIYRQAIGRMKLFSHRQILATWEQRHGRDALTPYGLAFLFAQNGWTGSSADVVVLAATRMFRETDHLGDLLETMEGLTGIARRLRSGGVADLATEMSNGGDRRRSGARYCGIAVSTMDLPDAPWHETRRGGEGLTLRSRVLGVMADNGRFRLETQERNYLSDTQVRATAVDPLFSNWRHEPATRLSDDETRDLWAALWGLHREFMGAQTAKDITKRTDVG